jgi:hypothetical protein
MLHFVVTGIWMRSCWFNVQWCILVFCRKFGFCKFFAGLALLGFLQFYCVRILVVFLVF